MKAIKIKDVKPAKNKIDALFHSIYPNGQWVNISSYEEKSKVNDDDVYFYLETDKEVNDIKQGDIIELDETFKVVEVE